MGPLSNFFDHDFFNNVCNVTKKVNSIDNNERNNNVANQLAIATKRSAPTENKSNEFFKKEEDARKHSTSLQGTIGLITDWNTEIIKVKAPSIKEVNDVPGLSTDLVVGAEFLSVNLAYHHMQDDSTIMLKDETGDTITYATKKIQDADTGLTCYVLTPTKVEGNGQIKDKAPMICFRGTNTSPQPMEPPCRDSNGVQKQITGMEANFQSSKGMGESVFETKLENGIETNKGLNALIEEIDKIANPPGVKFMGHSLGGTLAEIAALEFSDKVAGVCLFQSAGISESRHKSTLEKQEKIADKGFNFKKNGDMLARWEFASIKGYAISADTSHMESQDIHKIHKEATFLKMKLDNMETRINEKPEVKVIEGDNIRSNTIFLQEIVLKVFQAKEVLGGISAEIITSTGTQIQKDLGLLDFKWSFAGREPSWLGSLFS